MCWLSPLQIPQEAKGYGDGRHERKLTQYVI